MPPDPGLPVVLDVADRRCVVLGAGPVGARRARALLAAGARCEVVAPRADPAVVALAEAGALRWHRRRATEGDVAEAQIVVCATDDPGVNAALATAARRAGALVNRADDAGAGDLRFPAVVARGPVRVAVSAPGAPAVARWAGERVDDGLDALLGLDADGVALLVDVVAEVRAELAARRDGGEPTVTPGVNWRSAIDGSMLEHISRGRRAEAKDHLQACLSS